MTNFKGTPLEGITKDLALPEKNPLNDLEEQIEALGSDPTLPIVFQIVDWNKIRYFARKKKLIIGLDKFAIRKDQCQLQINIEIFPK